LRLLELQNLNVVDLDDLYSASKWNLPNKKRVKFIEGSVLQDDNLARAFDYRPELVFHLAAHFANQNSIDHPDNDLMVNGLGTLKILRLAHYTRVRRFVFAASR